MLRAFPTLAAAGLAFAGTATFLWANPYQSRLDREYKSLSQSISRAYSPPPPRPSYTPPARNYSSTPPSSSSSRSSSSSSSRSSWTPPQGSTVNRFAAEKRRYESQYAAKKAPTPARSSAPKSVFVPSAPARSVKPVPAAPPDPASPTHLPAEWARVRAETKGKAPLNAPPRRALESRRAEFAHYAPLARAGGAKAPWENLRAGQLSLLFQGTGAEPALAFAFFRQADPAWPETQLGLGLCHLRGFGTAPDPAQARAHLEQAAAYVSPDKIVTRYHGTGELFPFPSFQAARELGVAYDLGQGLPADSLLALHWYERADRLPLTTQDRDNLAALRREFWKRHAGRARELMEREFAANRAKAPGSQAVSASVLSGLVAAGNAAALFDLGEFVDTKNGLGEETTQGRSGISYFLAAARLGHEPAARAYFSPAKNGFTVRDLGGDPFWRQHTEFVRAEWPKWEKKFLAAAAAGDATAHLPLAFFYSGARGNPAQPDKAKHHAALLPATLPDAQRQAVRSGLNAAAREEGGAWMHTVWAALGGNFQTVDLRRLRLPPDPVRGAALRDEGIALASDDPKAARDRFRDAAALGDLPAQVQLWIHTREHNLFLGDYYKSLQARLEESATAGDRGAIATLAVLMGPGDLRFPTGGGGEGVLWNARARALAPHKAAFARIAAEPALSDDTAADLRAAAVAETAFWIAEAKKWGLGGTNLIYDFKLTDEAVRRSDDLRRQYVALAAAARHAAAQLPLWESTVGAGTFEPEAEADARMLQGLIAWLGDQEDRDLPAAFEALTESAALGHPLAPLALGYFFGSGHGGFPKDADLARRCRALTDARLTALAEDNDGWAQATLGGLLVEGTRPDVDHPAYPSIYAWLPDDEPRGRHWLRTAALAGHTLPDFFGNARGRTVAWYLSGGDADRPEASQWKLIDEIFYSLDEKSPTAAEEWNWALAKAREIIAGPPAASLARRQLDLALQQAETDEQQSAAQSARARALLAMGLPKLARLNAGFAARTNARDAAAWLLRAEVEDACRAPDFAAACRSIAQAIAGEPGAGKRFAAAIVKVVPDDQGELRLTIEVTLEEHPQFAPFQELKAHLDRLAPVEPSARR
jgi:TPR repeat protein